jgi:bacterioferritin (cytochrome b1)
MTDKEAAIEALNLILKDQMTNAVQYMQFHFRILHEESLFPRGTFRALAVEEMLTIEALATRVTRLGGNPPKQLNSYGIPENERDMLHETIKNEEQLIKEIRNIAGSLEEADSESFRMLEKLILEKENRLTRLKELL